MNKHHFLLYQWYLCLRINAFIFQKKFLTNQPAECDAVNINLPSLSNIPRNTHWWHSSKSFTASEKTGCLVWNFSRTWQITIFRSLKFLRFDIWFKSKNLSDRWVTFWKFPTYPETRVPGKIVSGSMHWVTIPGNRWPPVLGHTSSVRADES